MSPQTTPRRKMSIRPATAVSALLVMLSALCAPAHAAVLAAWDLHGLIGGSNNFGTSPLLATTAATNLIVGGLTRGAGVGTTGTAAARGWGGTDWATTSATAAVTAGDVVTLTLSAQAGYQLSLGSISRFDYRRSGSGATSGVVQYQVGSGSFTNIGNPLSYSSTASGGASLAAIDLSSIAALQNVPAGTVVTLRIVNYGASGAGGTWYVFDTANTTAADFEISGTVSASGPSVPGACGSAQGLTFPNAPAADLCSAGTPTAVTGGATPWSWSCQGLNGGSTASCSATSSADTGCQ